MSNMRPPHCSGGDLHRDFFGSRPPRYPNMTRSAPPDQRGPWDVAAAQRANPDYSFVDNLLPYDWPDDVLQQFKAFLNLARNKLTGNDQTQSRPQPTRYPNLTRSAPPGQTGPSGSDELHTKFIDFLDVAEKKLMEMDNDQKGPVDPSDEMHLKLKVFLDAAEKKLREMNYNQTPSSPQPTKTPQMTRSAPLGGHDPIDDKFDEFLHELGHELKANPNFGLKELITGKWPDNLTLKYDTLKDYWNSEKQQLKDYGKTHPYHFGDPLPTFREEGGRPVLVDQRGPNMTRSAPPLNKTYTLAHGHGCMDDTFTAAPGGNKTFVISDEVEMMPGM